VRDAVEGYLADDAEAEIDRRIIESYSRDPQEDLGLAEWAARTMISDEPWEKR
jgi:hypothetical protein